MKRFKLIINPSAEVDIEVAKKWYEIQKENLGTEFIKEAENVLLQIKKNPYQFSKNMKNIRKAKVKRFPFSIFYTIHVKTIIVFAVFNNSRNPIVWKNRLR
jgi:mRNA-degrading endonuclease RelE of RelBE toxin-antitoxin system